MPSKQRHWARLRYQALGSLLSVFLPYAVISALVPAGQGGLLLFTSAICSLLATLAGMVILRSVSSYPGVESSVYLLPAFFVSYGAMMIILLLGRISYSRPQIVASFILSIIWFYLTVSRGSRRRHMRIAVVPVGDVSHLVAHDQVEWHTLSSPDSPLDGAVAVTANLWADLPKKWERRLADFALQGIPVYHTRHLLESLTGRVELEHLSENTFGTLSPISAYMVAKRVIDSFVAAVALVVLLPVFLILAIVIRLNSPGPVIFRQRRVGYRGQPFTLYKFRTMTSVPVGADQRQAAMTQDADKRITSIGHFLRRMRIDELPQIINVLKGEMSWIGPRPEVDVLSQWYESEIPFYRYRHIVHPGITGWAQVSQGHVAEVEEVKSKLYYDFYYIKNYSLWLDVLIVVRTIRTMLTGFGAK